MLSLFKLQVVNTRLPSCHFEIVFTWGDVALDVLPCLDTAALDKAPTCEHHGIVLPHDMIIFFLQQNGYESALHISQQDLLSVKGGLYDSTVSQNWFAGFVRIV